MRRKSERTASKKGKSSPEKKDKVEKVKRTRTRRRKHSTSSDNESPEESSPPKVPEEEVPKPETNPPPVEKEPSPEESQEQVWQVKATEGSGDVGEIQKLKICLTRPPSTPERVDRSPRSKRKHSRATSSSDTPSVESDEKKKSKHRSKRSNMDSRDSSDKQDSQGDEAEGESEDKADSQKSDNQVSQSTETTEEQATDDTPMSTTNEEVKTEDSEKSQSNADGNADNSQNDEEITEDKKDTRDSKSQDKTSDADTTVASPKPEAEAQDESNTIEQKSPTRKRSASIEKSEILEIHADESRCESSVLSMNETQLDESKDESGTESSKVSTVEDKSEKSVSETTTSLQSEVAISTNKNDVVEGSDTVENKKEETATSESAKEQKNDETNKYDKKPSKELPSETPKIPKEIPIHNGQSTSSSGRKRRWGTRPKLSTQKSLTISTDVLKEIIPDVMPAEFEEVIEEKKHKRVEVIEKMERPVLPKIVIDNTENVEINRKEHEDRERDKENFKVRDVASARKISIVKENESIISRPPSPPRHKQSNILYITNLVRPFTLPQLKNLLQRTGRIAENGFWIDRIKSKCFVKYETEDQAVETRHALHGVTWPVSNPKTLHVDFSTEDDFDSAKKNEDKDNAQTSTIPGTVEDWLREQDLKRERGELEKPWERKSTREWDVGKNEKGPKEKEKFHRDERPLDKRRHRTPERSPEPARKFKKKEEEAPAKLLDDLFRKTKTTPCIYWLPLSAETIAVKEEQRRQHMAEHERRMQELRRTHRRH